MLLSHNTSLHQKFGKIFTFLWNLKKGQEWSVRKTFQVFRSMAFNKLWLLQITSVSAESSVESYGPQEARKNVTGNEAICKWLEIFPLQLRSWVMFRTHPLPPPQAHIAVELSDLWQSCAEQINMLGFSPILPLKRCDDECYNYLTIVWNHSSKGKSQDIVKFQKTFHDQYFWIFMSRLMMSWMHNFIHVCLS